MGSVLRNTFADFNKDKVLRLSAALAYYAMFSIGPLLVIAVGVAGLAFGSDHVRSEIANQLRTLLGSESAKTVESMMSARRSTSLVTTILGIIALLFGATGVFGQLQDSLNTIWKVQAKPGRGIWSFLRARFLSLTMVLGIGFLLLVSLALTTFLNAAMGSIGSQLPLSEAVAHVLNFGISFVVIALLFAMIFKFLPDVKIPFRNVWLGALLTALLFTIGKYLLALYLGRESVASAYGAAGSVIVVLMWVYYASVILFLGAEFTHAYTIKSGTKIAPTKYATFVTAEERARQGMPQSNERPTVAAAHCGPLPGEVISRSAARFWKFVLVTGVVGKWLYQSRPFRRRS